MPLQPAVSIIIPSYNRRALLQRAIDSVLAQNYPAEVQLIVVDDGSDDGTAEFLKQHYFQIELIEQQNRGVSAARNRGIEAARSDWIALLDSDDEWLPNKLALQFAELDKTQLKICHGEEIWVRNGVRVNPGRIHQKRAGDLFLQCLELCAMSPSSIVIHRSVFDHVGRFDETLPACEDYDLWLRICAQYSVALVSDPCIIKYGGHEDQLSKKHWGMDRFRVQALENLLDGPLSVAQKTAAMAMLKRKLTILRQGAKKRNNRTLQLDCEQRLARADAHQ